MALTRKIEIDGKEIPFRASATVPRLYRGKFRRDIFKDLTRLMDAFKAAGIQNTDETDDEDQEERSGVFFSSLDIDTLEMFENVAYIMARHADPEHVPDTPEEWLEQFDTFSIYVVLPQLLELWNLNTETQIESKKNIAQLTGK